jgi:hypothetical protein
MTALATNSVFAQQGRARIGFDFKIGRTTYPAGTYWIERSAANLGVVSVKGISKNTNQGFVSSLQMSARDDQSPKLVFKLINGSYYLSEMYFAEGKTGYRIQLPKNHRLEDFLGTVTTVECSLTNRSAALN